MKKGTVIIIVIIPLALIGAFLIAVWRMGVFDIDFTSTNVDVLTPVLALFGAIIGAIVTIIGTSVKHSVDQRNADLKDQAEKRLAQEAVIQAIQSLSTGSGKWPAPIRYTTC